MERTILSAALALGLFILAAGSPAAAQTIVPNLVGPEVILSTYYGGPSNDCADDCSVAVDAQGYIYFAGSTSSSTFPLVNPLFALSNGVFVVKLAPGGGTVVYSTYLVGGSAQGIAVDAAGRAYVTGYTTDNSFPVTPDALKSTLGVVDAFLAVLSADGQQLVYATYLGGSGRDEGSDVGLDAAGNIYLTGWTTSADFPVQSAVQASFGGVSDAFIMRINADFTLGYSTYAGGASDDKAWAIAVDDQGSAIMVGRTISDDFPVTPGALQTERNGLAAAVIARFGSDGQRVYSTLFNQSSTSGIAVTTDGSGAAHVLTSTEGIIRLNPSGSALTFWTEPQLEVDVGGKGGIAVDSAGNTYAVGRIGPGGNKDVKLVVLNRIGSIVAERTWGGSANDFATDIAIGAGDGCAETAFLTGSSASIDYPTTPGSLQPASGGGSDAILKLLGPLPTCTVQLPLTWR